MVTQPLISNIPDFKKVLINEFIFTANENKGDFEKIDVFDLYLERHTQFYLQKHVLFTFCLNNMHWPSAYLVRCFV